LAADTLILDLQGNVLASVPGPPAYGGIVYWKNGELKAINSSGVRTNIRSRVQLWDDTFLGMYATTFPLGGAPTATICIDGTIYLVGVYLASGDVVRKIHTSVTATGTGVSTALCGLYNTSLARLGITADLSAQYNTTGMTTGTLTTPYEVTVSGAYYLAFLAKTATTMPTLARGASATLGINAPINSKPVVVQTKAAQTTLTDPIATPSSSGTINVWFGVS